MKNEVLQKRGRMSNPESVLAENGANEVCVKRTSVKKSKTDCEDHKFVSSVTPQAKVEMPLSVDATPLLCIVASQTLLRDGTKTGGI